MDGSDGGSVDAKQAWPGLTTAMTGQDEILGSRLLEIWRQIDHRLRGAAVNQADAESVAATATEYFQAWFAGDSQRVRACLHPALAMRTPEEPGSARLDLHEDPTDVLVADTASGEGTSFEPKQEVTVLDVFQDIATVMVRSQPITEYLHLGRFGDRWLIVNALYLVLA